MSELDPSSAGTPPAKVPSRSDTHPSVQIKASMEMSGLPHSSVVAIPNPPTVTPVKTNTGQTGMSSKAGGASYEPSLYFYDRWGRNGCDCRCFCPQCQCGDDRYRCCSRDWWKVIVAGLHTMSCRRVAESYFVDKWIVMLVRAAMAVYASTVLLTSWAGGVEGGYWFAYFTNLSYLGLTAYLWIATWISVQYVRNTQELASLDKARTVDVVASVMYTTSFAFHLIVLIVYWSLLASNWNYAEKTEMERWLNISKHGLNFALIFIEFFLNRIVFLWGHLIIFLLTFILYLFWTWIAAAMAPTRGPYSNGFPYFFVDYTAWYCFPAVVGMSVFFSLLWSLGFLFHWAKVRIGTKVLARRNLAVA